MVEALLFYRTQVTENNDILLVSQKLQRLLWKGDEKA